MISLVVARARNGAIGRDNTIPWDLPEDLKAFARETAGGAVIMGRNTWDSLPVKPLPRRLNIVVSSDPTVAENVAPSVEAAIAMARAAGHLRIYGIGGAGIYRAMLPLADRLVISEVETVIPDADTFFPDFDSKGWTLLNEHILRASDPRCVVREFVRTR